MARYQITAPDGKRYEVTAPEGANERDVLDYAQRQFGQRQTGPTTAESTNEFADQALRGIYRGADALLTLPGKAIGGVMNMVSPGSYGGGSLIRPPSEMISGETVKPTTEAGRYGESIGQAIGGSILPTAGIAARAAQAAGPAARTTIGGIGQRVVEGFRANPRAALAADAVASVGAGTGQQMAQEGGFGPTGQMIGGLAGGIAPVAVMAGGQAAIRPIQAARANMGEAGAYGRVSQGLPGGVDQLADEIAAGASRNNVRTNRRTLDILGEEMQRAGGNVQAAQQATIQRISQEFGVTPGTAAEQIRRLTAVHRDSHLMLGEYPAVSGSDRVQRLRDADNIDLDELGRTQASRTQDRLDYLANNGNAQSAQTVRNAISRRQEDLSPAMRETLEGFGPQVQTGPRSHRPATIVDSADAIERARQAGSAEYQAAYSGPIDNNVSLYWLPRMLAWHEGRAANRSGDIERAIRQATDQFYISTPNGRLAMGTLQQLQDARGAVRGQIEGYRRAGNDALVRAVQPIYEHATRIMGNMSPQWARANARWADMNFLRIGEELGEAFSTRAGPQFRQQMAEYHRLAPEAQSIVQIHFLQRLFDRLDNLGDTRSVSQLFSNDHSRNMIRALFGDEAAVTFTRAVRDQRVAEQSQRMMGNSATHRRGMAQRQEDAETGLTAAVENANVRGVRNWLLERATQILTENRNRPMAGILTTPMSDTASVARHLHRMGQQESRLRHINAPRQRQLPAAGIGGSMPGAFNDDERRAR